MAGVKTCHSEAEVLAILSCIELGVFVAIAGSLGSLSKSGSKAGQKRVKSELFRCKELVLAVWRWRCGQFANGRSSGTWTI